MAFLGNSRANWSPVAFFSFLRVRCLYLLALCFFSPFISFISSMFGGFWGISRQFAHRRVSGVPFFFALFVALFAFISFTLPRNLGFFGHFLVILVPMGLRRFLFSSTCFLSFSPFISFISPRLGVSLGRFSVILVPMGPRHFFFTLYFHYFRPGWGFWGILW